MEKRRPDLVVISDVHLGSYGCHAGELITYLKSIQPGVLILNGDIVDIWQFRKSYWPEPHMKVLKCLMGMLTRGTTIYYLTGNHDEMLRKYSPFRLGNFHLVDKLVLEICGAGFETPSEAMHLGKRILAVPMTWQYEQQCNAAALGQMGVTVHPAVDRRFPEVLADWLDRAEPVKMAYPDQTEAVIARILNVFELKKSGTRFAV